MKRFTAGLLGRRLGHSYSPLIHSMLGEYEYRLFEREPDDVADFLRGGEFDALNVTIPYKKTVMPFCSRLSETAARTGSVNTIIRESGGLVGFNTDYDGFSHALRNEGIEAAGKRCALLGDGGAAATVRAVLNDMGAAEVVTVSRHGAVKFGDISKYGDAEIIVNATPVGMFPNNGEAPVALSGFSRLEFVCDLIYNPNLTALLLECRRLGIRHANGLAMLVGQARRSAELFVGEKIADETVETVTKRVTAAMLNVVIIGMPGCGKSAVGHALSRLMSRPFADTDEYVRDMTGETPESIILSRGEGAFREIEREAVERVGKLSGYVIATGGGAVTRRENFNALKQNGVIIFIDVPPERLDSTGRPLSGDLSRRRELYGQRLPLYRDFADITVRAAESETPIDIAARIEKLL